VEEEDKVACWRWSRWTQSRNLLLQDPGSSIKDFALLTIKHVSIVVLIKARTENESVESQRDAQEKKCNKFKREQDGMTDRGREQGEGQCSTLSWRSIMKSAIGQVEETNKLSSQQFETSNHLFGTKPAGGQLDQLASCRSNARDMGEGSSPCWHALRT
jgi:hypothetical protein